MIRITVTMIPRGDGRLARTMCVAEITNDGTGDVDHGNYDVRFSRMGQQRTNTWKEVRVENFPRQRLNVWHLLWRALREAVR